MGFVSNIPISIKEQAFSDVAPKQKRVAKILVGAGNGYSSDSKDSRFIKVFFGNNKNQTTKTLSYTKPLNTKEITEVIGTFTAIMKKENYQIDRSVEVETEGISLKDRKDFREFIDSFCR